MKVFTPQQDWQDFLTHDWDTLAIVSQTESPGDTELIILPLEELYAQIDREVNLRLCNIRAIQIEDDPLNEK